MRLYANKIIIRYELTSIRTCARADDYFENLICTSRFFFTFFFKLKLVPNYYNCIIDH